MKVCYECLELKKNCYFKFYNKKANILTKNCRKCMRKSNTHEFEYLDRLSLQSEDKNVIDSNKESDRTSINNKNKDLDNIRNKATYFNNLDLRKKKINELMGWS